MQKTRIEWIDVARAITMLCVVIGHVIPAGHIRTFLYSFHVPAFFFLSGIFYSSDESFFRSAVKRFKSIMIPYYFFGLFSIVVYILLGDLVSGHEVNSFSRSLYGLMVGSVKTSFMRFNYHLWFLPVLFVMNLIMHPVHRFIKYLSSKKQIDVRLLMSGATLVFFCFSQLIFTYKTASFLPLGADTALRLIPFFVAGCTASNFKGFMSPPKKAALHITLYAVSAFLLFALTGLLSKLNEIRTADAFHINYMRDAYGDRLLFLSAAIFGIIAVVLLSKAIPPVKPITYMGQKTLALLVLQKFPIMLFNSVIPFTSVLINSGNIFAVVLLSLAVIAICLAANFVIEKLSPFVYGKPYRRK